MTDNPFGPGEAERYMALMEHMGFVDHGEEDRERGFAQVRFRAKPAMCHSFGRAETGIVQGGFVTGWLDNAMYHAGHIAAKDGRALTTADLTVSFYAAAYGETLYTAEGWVEKAGRSLAFLGGRLLSPEGEVIAKASSTGRWIGSPS